MMREQEVLQLLQQVGAVITNSHIVYTSGKHGSAYVNKDAVYPYTQLTSLLCQAIVQRVLSQGQAVQAVIAPAIGGVLLSQGIAKYLTDMTGRQVTGVYAEKETVPLPDPENKGRRCYAETGEFVIKRGYEMHVHNKALLVVDDILNTGGSACKVVEATRRAGGAVVAVAALCNRGNVQPADVGNPGYLLALANITMDAWDEASCPLCAKGVPINTEVGKGRDFLAQQQ